MRKCNTTKLFYGEYPYKLVWYSPVSHYYRGPDASTIRQMLDSLQRQYQENGKMQIHKWSGVSSVSTKELHDAQKVFTAITKNPCKIRVEGCFVQIYAAHIDWLEKLSDQIDAYELWAPEGLLQPNTIVMGETMRGWEYRIKLGTDVPQGFFKWAKANLDKIKAGPVFKEILDDGGPYGLNGLYFYVKNDKMLNLATLVLGPSIKSIDKIIIEDKNA